MNWYRQNIVRRNVFKGPYLLFRQLLTLFHEIGKKVVIHNFEKGVSEKNSLIDCEITLIVVHLTSELLKYFNND